MIETIELHRGELAATTGANSVPEAQIFVSAGRIAMSDAAARIGEALAARMMLEADEKVRTRELKLEKYIHLLGNPPFEINPDYVEELSSLSREFYRPLNYAEQALIMDAGGITHDIC